MTTHAFEAPGFGDKEQKILVSFLAGIFTFFLSGHGLSVAVGEITINIPWALSLSVLVALAYGPKYTLVTAFSGGALYPFKLWPTNGYLNIVDSGLLLMLLLLVANTRYYLRPEQNNQFFRRLSRVIILYLLMATISYVLLGNFVLSLNPPFWISNAVDFLPTGTFASFVIKDAINLLFVLMVSIICLTQPVVRRFFDLPVTPSQRDNHKVVIYSCLAVLCIWLIFICLDFVLLESDGWYFKAYFPLALWVLVFSGMIVARVIIRFSEQRNYAMETLLKAKNSAEESDRLKSAFLANLSHEIRTPMNAIIGFTDLMNSHDLDKDQQAYYLGIIEKSGMHLLSLINDIIEVSRIESGQVKVSAGIINAKKLIDEVHETIRITVPRDKQIELLVVANEDANTPVLVTDEVKLRQIMLNLVGNAIKFTHQGQVKFGFSFVNDEFHFFVEDTGIGIDEKFHHVIFERFRQVEGDSNIKAGGSGLGLAICKAYTQLLGGTISIKSRLGLGSRFDVTLPRIINPHNRADII